jgi:CRP/FNR family transcriptional regulator
MQVGPIKPNGEPGVTLPAQAKKPPIPECDRCAGRSPAVSATLGNNGLATSMAMTGPRHWAKRQILYDGNVEADAFYRITKGIVAEYKGFADGRRQIVAIRTVGDICGYPSRNGRYAFSGQAITPVDACAFGAEQFRATMERDNAFASDVADEVSERLNQALIRRTVVGQFCALERVAHFILDMQKRLPSCSIHMGTLILHLTHQEIAEYLGLKLETVSRSFSKLRDMRLIALCGADAVTILDKKRLCDVASGRL